MVNSTINELFKTISRLKVLVVGDVMIDAYVWGKVDRISPEAPVAVVAVEKKEKRLGGAANVAINIQALDATPFLCGIVGKDVDGDEFISMMKAQGMKPDGIIKLSKRRTTVKTRVIGNNHQLIRVDEESLHDLNDEESKIFASKIISLLDKFKIDVVIFEDYDKGALNKNVIDAVTNAANAKGIKITVDPKKKNFADYKNVSLFKPNLGELKTGLKIDLDKTDASSIRNATSTFIKKNNFEMMMVTLSEHGVYYSTKNKAEIIPAHIRNISDVSGAGDTVISVASCCLAAGIDSRNIAAIANLAGGLVCEKVGVVPIDKQQLMDEIEKEKILI
ncbi:MAG: bifunctional ADP-heptose synthase [Bacteroidia bacterium]